MERIKASVSIRTIQIALGGLAVCIISIFLPWLSASVFGINVSYSMVEAFRVEPEWFEGVPALLAVGLLWMLVLYLLGHPKIALIGVVPLAIVWLGMFVTADESGFSLSIGAFVYLLGLIVCIVMSFMTKKIPGNGAGPNMPGNWNGPQQ